MAGGRRALVVATYDYADGGLSRLEAPAHDAESFASVLADPAIAGFDVTMLVDKPHHVVGEAIADFYGSARRDDLTLLYFTGHGVKDDEGRLYLAMNNTRREALMFTAISAAQLNDAMDASASRRKVLVLDCCYSGAFPAGRTAKSDEGVQTLERFQGKGRAVLTASDATQYAFEGNDLRGSARSSVFTRHLVEAISSGAADLDEDGDIALDELYSYVYDRVVAEVPQQRPKKQEDVEGRIVIARNVHWTLPIHLRHAVESPLPAQRLSAVEGLAHLHRVGNEVVRAAVEQHVAALAEDDSRAVSAAATALLERFHPAPGPPAPPAPVARPEVPAPRVVRQPVAEPVAAPQGRDRSGGTAPAGGRAPEPPPRTRMLVAPPARPPKVGPPPTAPAGAETPTAVPLVLALLLVAGVAELLSRFLVFEATGALTASQFGQPTPPWLLAVALPSVIAVALLVARGGQERGLVVAGGLVAAAALSQFDQTLAVAGFFASPDTSELPGPGWWASAVAAVALLACAVVVMRRVPALRARPALARRWRTVVATVVVLVALTLRLDAFAEAGPWFAHNEPAILLALACLPATLLHLSRQQRMFGLLAVTVFGLWTSVAHVYAFLLDDHPVDEAASALGVVACLISVAACWLAQVGTGEPEPRTVVRGRVPAVLFGLMVAAGMFLTVSRFTVFESANGYHADEMEWSTAGWVVQTLLPLVLAAGVLLTGARAPTAVAGGLVAGVALSVVCQLVMSLAVFLDPDQGYGIGPAWWLILVAGLLLAGGATIVAASSLGERADLQRGLWRVRPVALVVVAVAAWIVTGDVSTDSGWGQHLQFAGLLLSVACLPITVLAMNERQRTFGLAAVTATGAWLLFLTGEIPVVESSGSYRVGALVSAAFATLLAVGAAWLAQGPARRPRRTVVE